MSVVVPAYNAERHVARAIESALGQTYADLEVIAVDDGSTDCTRAVLNGFGDRIRLLTQENRGIGAARNAAIRVASGEVIALLDADDEWLPERVSRCLELLDARPDIAFVTTDATIVDEQGVPTGETYLDQVLFPEDGFAAGIVQENFVWVGAFVRRSVLERVGLFDETPPTGVEDYDLWLRLIADGVTPGIVREPLALYRVHPGSVTRRDGRLRTARNLALARRLPLFWRQGVHGPATQALDVAWTLLQRGDVRGAIRFVVAATKDPDLTTPGVLASVARNGSRRALGQMGSVVRFR